MQFIVNGPDIPDALLQAHEEGRVIFFCGAGISYPAGLPGFRGLVDDIYRLNGTAPSAIESVALRRGQYDATLDLLERRLPGQRLALRRALADALRPKLRRKGSTATHESLLRLARDRNGALRLVTTNFDRVFHVAAKRSAQSFNTHAAPLLPIPKSSRWNGLVYLHGLLPQGEDEAALNRLVLTSGDFGLAYLTERWAARFVSELFRNYVVCFVGYSINDPVLRYMMDALAADRMLGEATPQAWALGDCEPGQESIKTIEWEAKGVTPILYEVAPSGLKHSALHDTLHAWAETYRDGINGKERIVVAHALSRPSVSTRQDDFVGRVLWALSDPSGLPAKRFADFNPVPSLDWLLDAFCTDRFGFVDLPRFGVAGLGHPDLGLKFSLVNRPAPYSLAPKMRLVEGDLFATELDEVMVQISRWLVRHLDDPRVILWAAERGGRLHDLLAWHVERRLEELSKLEREGKVSELEALRLDAPKSVPSAGMRTLWRLLIGGHVKTVRRRSDLFTWKQRLEHEGLSVALRLELRELLAPKVQLSRPFRWGSEEESSVEPPLLRQLVSWELVLTADHVHSILAEQDDAHWQAALPALFDDIQALLRDALDLLGELGESGKQSDRSHWDLPSISAHWQNRGFHDWVALIELTRDAWLAMRVTDPSRAVRVAMAWFGLPYPTFKRLALFAASQDQSIDQKQWVEWLLADESHCLWSLETRREVMRLLALQGGRLEGVPKTLLEAAIISGPSRKAFNDQLEIEEWVRISAHAIWLRLAKLSAADVKLGEAANRLFSELSNTHPDWKLAANESDEFSHWTTGTGDPGFEESRYIDIAPRNRRELTAWLVKAPNPHRGFYEDTWSEVCRTRFYHSVSALWDLARKDVWPTQRWREALQVWSEDGIIKRAAKYVPTCLLTMPEQFFRELVHSVSWWLKTASKQIIFDEKILIKLLERVMGLSLDFDSGIKKGNGDPLEEPLTEAINHPIGHVAQALIDIWLRRAPNDNDGLPSDVRPLMTQLCDTEILWFRHARVILASQLIALFRVDAEWTEQHLLPKFDWATDLEEARAVWEGFLWAPRLYRPLLLALKLQLLQTASFYNQLKEHPRQFSAFLTYAALGPLDGYSVIDWRTAIEKLPQEGLNECAQALAQALEGASEQREEYWRNRVRPFWKEIWPKNRSLATPEISQALARLSIAAGGEFPEVLNLVRDWIQPINHPHYVVHNLLKSGLCSSFPLDSLRLLDAIKAKSSFFNKELSDCLMSIVGAAPELVRDPMYLRLK